MIFKQLKDISVLQFELLIKQKDVFHFVTTRHGGVSEGNYSSFNLSTKVEDDPENVQINRKILAASTGIKESKFYFPDQEHTDHCEIIDKKGKELSKTDALITSLPDVAICVTTADCVPVLLYSPDKKVAGVVHAGWKGQLAKLPFKVVARMKEEFQCDASSMIACIGPCISAEVYEVGNDVIHSVFKAGWTNGVIKNVRNNKGFLNLVEMTKQQLLESGLKDDHIEFSGICTFQNTNDFYSARKDGFKTGRFVSGIMLKQ